MCMRVLLRALSVLQTWITNFHDRQYIPQENREVKTPNRNPGTITRQEYNRSVSCRSHDTIKTSFRFLWCLMFLLSKENCSQKDHVCDLHVKWQHLFYTVSHKPNSFPQIYLKYRTAKEFKFMFLAAIETDLQLFTYPWHRWKNGVRR